MKNYYKYSLLIASLVLTLAACEDVEDNMIPHIASPVLLETTAISDNEPTDQVIATFYELDKSGIMDNTIGIDSIPIANLDVQVFSGDVLIGDFTTDAEGSFTVTYDPTTLTDMLEWAGTYNEVAFRIRK